MENGINDMGVENLFQGIDIFREEAIRDFYTDNWKIYFVNTIEIKVKKGKDCLEGVGGHYKKATD